MYEFFYRVLVYLVCFGFALYGLSGLDFNRFLKQGKVAQANILYILLAIALAYLCGNFLIDIIYALN